MRKLVIAAAIITPWLSAPAAAADPKIDDLVVTAAASDARRDAVIGAARAFYRFWDSGDRAALDAAIAPTFVDHTLPEGRPQGPAGPAFASEHFRAAVPDLHVTVRKMIVAGDYVTVHMQFTGHFTGRFGAVAGQGQPIDFIATDLIKVTDDRITDNWHIEDNLTLLSKMGIARVAQ